MNRLDLGLTPIAINDATKECSCCLEAKPKTSFHTDNSRADGRFADCKRCNNIRRQFTGSDAYWRIVRRFWQWQRGLCPVCSVAIDLDTDAMALDHPHQPQAMESAGTYASAITGLLHRNCNLGIGHLNDDPEVLRAAAAYVERTRGAA